MTNELVVSNNYIAPVVDIQSAVARYKAFKEFVSKVLVKGTDYGEVPGTDKPTLLKPGAEKLSTFFGLRPIFLLQESINDWTGKEHDGESFFFREYKCQCFRGGELIGEGIGSCNSWEKKYRYRWVNEMDLPAGFDVSGFECRDGAISEFTFAIEKAETSGKYGKPKEYWQMFTDAMADGTAKHIQRKTKKGDSLEAIEIGCKLYAIPNKDVADQVNTIDKMAQKRALVAAVLITTNASDYFTQDMEDYDYGSDFGENKIIEGEFNENKQPTQPPKGPSEEKALRPFPPEKVAEILAAWAQGYRDQPDKFRKAWNEQAFTNAKGEPKTARDKFIWQFSQLCLGNDDIRYKASTYLFGVPSSKDIDDENIFAALQWMKFWQKPDTGEWVPGKHVQAELNAIIDFISGETKSNGEPVTFEDQEEIPY